MNWKPISTAPKDGTKILLYIPDWNDIEHTISVGWYSEMQIIENGKITTNITGWNVQQFIFRMGDDLVTHWMPLPPTPC